MVKLDRHTVTIGSDDFVILPETFAEGAVRRQAEFAYLGEEDLKSRPDTREWLHNSWIGGSQWEKPLYGRGNQDTYFESGDLSFTDRAGAVQQSAELRAYSATLGSPTSKLAAWTEDGVDGVITYVNTIGSTWQWYEWNASGPDTFDAVASRTDTHLFAIHCMAISSGPDGFVYALMNDGTVAYYDPTANTNSQFTSGRNIYNGGALWVDRDYVWIWNGDTLYRYNTATVKEVQEVWTDGTGGTFKLALDQAASGTIAYNASAGTVETAVEGISGITAVDVTGTGSESDPWVITFTTPAGELSLLTADDDLLTGQETGTLVERTVYGRTQFQESDAAMADDDDGRDVFSNTATWLSTAVIPEWSCTRAITTSEGIFYVKNAIEGGLSAAKVYRVDRDASGAYINTPIGTLPKGQVAMNIAHHLGSIVISTVPNFPKAVANTADQKVTLYHVTGRSIGAIGSPLGGTNVDETPCWLLGVHDEMLFIGGRKRLWQYDGRVGALHAHTTESEAKFLNYGSGYTDMSTVQMSIGSSAMFLHTSQDGAAAAPYFQLSIDDRPITTAADTAFVTSNWFDFELPMEEKTIYEVFYDSEHIRTDSTVTIQISADGGSFTTVATITGGSSADTLRTAVATPITGYKFQYKLVFSTDTVTSSAEPGRVYAVGFAAMGGEMVDMISFTIDASESCNLENNVLYPRDVYDLMSTLRDTKEEVTITHTLNSFESDDPKSGTYRIATVMGRAIEGQVEMYEVQAIEVAS